MKTVRRILALMLVAVISLAVTGCLHKKDEIAVTVNGVEFKSAYYMCALINADMEAKNLVYESLTDEEKQSTELDYYSKKIEGKNYVEWVEDKAIDTLKQVAAYKLLCKENKVELDKEEIATIESNAAYYWAYGYSSYFVDNGVSEATYIEYSKDALYAESYFKFLYAKDGEKAISDEDVKTKIYENFEIANILAASYEEGATDESKKALKTKLDGYASDLKAGKKTFEQVYVDYNGDEEHSHEETESDEPQPKDPHAQVLGTEDTNYHTEDYETVKNMKVGEIKVVESGTGVTLYVKKDIKADDYYLTALDMDARHLIADEDFEKLVEEYAKKLKADVSSYAVGQFNVKKIKEPTY